MKNIYKYVRDLELGTGDELIGATVVLAFSAPEFHHVIFTVEEYAENDEVYLTPLVGLDTNMQFLASVDNLITLSNMY